MAMPWSQLPCVKQVPRGFGMQDCPSKWVSLHSYPSVDLLKRPGKNNPNHPQTQVTNVWEKKPCHTFNKPQARCLVQALQKSALSIYQHRRDLAILIEGIDEDQVIPGEVGGCQDVTRVKMPKSPHVSYLKSTGFCSIRILSNKKASVSAV